MTTAALVLAAGKGTRFRSDLPKVLHTAAGRTLLRWVLEAVRPLRLEHTVVVVGQDAGGVVAEARGAGVAGLGVVEQREQRGTGHAVRCAAEAGALDGVDTVIVLPGDAPLLDADTLAALLDAHRAGGKGRAVTLLTALVDDPTGYGRVLRAGAGAGAVVKVVEDRDASPAEREVREVNTSIYAFAAAALADGVRRLSAHNDQGEEYLTDVVEPLAAHGAAGAVRAAADRVAGVNDRAQLASVAARLRARILRGLMLDGVTVVDPAATYVGADVSVGRDAVLLPGTHLEGTTTVGDGARVGPNSRLVDAVVEADASVAYSLVVEASVGPGAEVGPFTYLRPGTRLEAGAKAGAFVEMKNATVGEGSKVPHLSYVGDAQIGRGANVGAATVTANYDGFAKHRTVIGDGARIGSDTMLVAPVTVGAHAYTGAGSVITRDVPDGALAVERSEQRVVEGYAERRRRRHQADQDRST